MLRNEKMVQVEFPGGTAEVMDESEHVTTDHWVPRIHKLENGWGASLPFRQITTVGETPELAVASLIETYCKLSKRGSIAPENPNRPAYTFDQHILSIYVEQMEGLVHVFPWRKGNSPHHVIASMGTAIAAIARANSDSIKIENSQPDE